MLYRFLLGLPPPRKVDFDAEAAAILNSATRAVKAILDRRAALDREGKADVPLVVITGERHSVPAHRVHHMAVIKALREQEPTVVSLEAPHNLSALTYKHLTEIDPNLEVKDRLKASDRIGDVSIKSAIVESDDHTRTTFFRFLSHNEIPVRFTDAAVTDRNLIDYEDPSTADSLPAEFNRAANPLAYQKEGVEIRNRHMAKAAASHAREHGARILFHICGGAHIAGDKTLKFPGSESLSAYFKAQSLPVLAMPIAFKDWEIDELPEDSGLDASEVHIATGVPEREAREPSPVEILGNGPYPEFITQDEEADYLNGLLRRTGFRDYQLGLFEFDEEQCSARRDLTRFFLNLG